MGERVEQLVNHMTLEEKISMLSGADAWHTVPIKRLGIPAIKVTDGPIGARGASSLAGPSSACFPCGTALAATWNTGLVERVGRVLAEETQAKGAHILLAPTVNIHRSPLAGRNFECYSEDPYLTARMAVAYIKGLQSGGVGACIKHFVCNDSEFERMSISSEVGERALREIYLRPFQIAIQEAHPWAVMSSYNKVNGVPASENDYILLDILKGEWGFEGIVISDWGGTYSPNVVKGGLDLEMPGPARWMGNHALEAVRNGLVSQAVIDDKVRRLLRVIEKAGAFEQPELRPEQAIDKPEHRRLAYQAASEAIVLLKNSSGLLPLKLDQLKSIAVIGANAKWAAVMGGGSVGVRPHYVVTPLEAIIRRAGARVGYALGCAINKRPPLFEPGWLRTATGESGLLVQYFGNRELAGSPVHTEVIDRTEMVWAGDVAPHIDPTDFSVRLSAILTAPEDGVYKMGVMCVGQCRVLIEGQIYIDLWSKQPAAIAHRGVEKVVEVAMKAGQPYRLVVEYACEPEAYWRNLRLGCQPPVPADSIQQAAALAAKSDVAIVFAGLTAEWESEGFDRPDMELPGQQAELIEQVAAANPNTIVVLNTGSPVTMNWLDRVVAVVQAWYLGQETGNAIADVLFGEVNPSGKLPTTFPRRLQDNPAYINYPGENGQVLYGEGIFVGYRYYDKKDIAPLFPFGYGLSYTTFAYSNLRLDAAEYAAGDVIRVSVDVQNTGTRAGQEVVQLYVRDVQSRLMRPEKELKAFAKVALEPGETKTVTLALDQDALSYYDPAEKRWVAEPGEIQVLVGSSSRDIRLQASFYFKGGEAGPKRQARLNTGLPLRMLLGDQHGRAVLERHLGTYMAMPEVQLVLDMSLEQIAAFAPTILTQQLLKAINDDLAGA